MSIGEFNLACVNLLLLAAGIEESGFNFELCPFTDRMYATPLNAAIYAASEIVTERKKKYEIANTIFITDGEDTSLPNYISNKNQVNHITNNTYLIDDKTKIHYRYEVSQLQRTSVFLEIFKSRTKSNILGIFILPSDKFDKQKYILQYSKKDSVTDYRVLENKLQKDGYLLADDSFGYSEFFMVEGNKKLKIKGTSKVEDDGNISVEKMFRLMGTSYQQTRKQFLLLTKFIKMIS
jgi:hypothetical protein